MCARCGSNCWGVVTSNHHIRAARPCRGCCCAGLGSRWWIMLGWVRSRAACACVARGSTAPYAARGRHTAYRPSGVAGASHTTVQGHGSTNGTAQTQPGAWARMVHMQNVPPLASLRAGGAVPASLGQSGAVWDAASVSDPSSVDFPHGTRGKPAGVAFEAHRNKWRAYIKLKNKSVHLGRLLHAHPGPCQRQRSLSLAHCVASPCACRHIRQRH